MMNSTSAPLKPLAPISRAACIGGGVIGGGWIARLLLAGVDVRVFDRIRRRSASSARSSPMPNALTAS